jgi:Galactose-3-O-sulfotransferase
MQFGLHEYLPQPSTYITFLRRPAERIISYWETARREAAARPESELWLLQAARTMTLEEAMRTGNHIEFDNGQVRRISGIKAPVGQCTTEMLAKANDDMEQYFSFVGLTNYFDESLLLLRRILRWRKPPSYAKPRVTPAKCDCSRVNLKLIKTHRKLDSTFYGYAEAEFADLLAEAGTWLEPRAPRF